MCQTAVQLRLGYGLPNAVRAAATNSGTGAATTIHETDAERRMMLTQPIAPSTPSTIRWNWWKRSVPVKRRPNGRSRTIRRASTTTTIGRQRRLAGNDADSSAGASMAGDVNTGGIVAPAL